MVERSPRPVGSPDETDRQRVAAHTTASGAPATVELAASGLVLAGEPLAASDPPVSVVATRRARPHWRLSSARRRLQGSADGIPIAGFAKGNLVVTALVRHRSQRQPAGRRALLLNAYCSHVGTATGPQEKGQSERDCPLGDNAAARCVNPTPRSDFGQESRTRHRPQQPLTQAIIARTPIARMARTRRRARRTQMRRATLRSTPRMANP